MLFFSVSNLNVRGLGQIFSTRTTATIGWREPDDATAVSKYIISWTSTTVGSGTIFASVGRTGKQITGLQSGTEYSITVTSVVTHLDQTTSPGAATVRTSKCWFYISIIIIIIIIITVTVQAAVILDVIFLWVYTTCHVSVCWVYFPCHL